MRKNLPLSPLNKWAFLSKDSINPASISNKQVRLFSIPGYDAHSPESVSGNTIKSTKFIVPKKCVLFSKLNPRIPRIWCVENDNSIISVASTEFLVVLPRNENDLNWLYYVLSDPKFIEIVQSKVSGTSGSHQRIRPDDFFNIKVPYPEETNREGIVNIIKPLDDKIELNRKMNATLEEMAQTLFKSWFIDFDPVHAKAKGKKPQGMSEEIAALFPGSFEESEIGMIPKGWKTCELGQYIKFYKGKKAVRSTDRNTLPLIAISVFDGQDPEMVIQDKMVISNQEDILMVMDGASSGRVETGYSGVVGSTLAKITVQQNELRRYVYSFLKSRELEIQTQTTGTSIPHANKRFVEAFLICKPPTDILKIFAEHAETILNKIVLNNFEAKSLIKLKNTLLPKLLSGEISVKDAEKQIKKSI